MLTIYPIRNRIKKKLIPMGTKVKNFIYLLKNNHIFFLFLLLFVQFTGFFWVFFSHTTAVYAIKDNWPTYLYDVARSGKSNDTTISASNAGQLVKRWTYHTGRYSSIITFPDLATSYK